MDKNIKSPIGGKYRLRYKIVDNIDKDIEDRLKQLCKPKSLFYFIRNYDSIFSSYDRDYYYSVWNNYR
jgi:hypothetical protein